MALWVPVIVGGTATVWGPVLGAAVAVLAPELVNRQLGIDHLYVYGALLTTVALFRPSGLIRPNDVERLDAAIRRIVRRARPAESQPGRQPKAT